ncbi:hypothetical protein [uncultured Aquimarina sp.]|uniref:hypothetical protein n=1 Tax=uncultured Aquimarina sp. TaxID=575652 RepID=UPI00260547B0|nr:hypothetical protein [uncultured Aquimarina sp.]
MKTIFELKSKELNNNFLSKILGGTDHPTCINGADEPDVWSDNDDDGKFSVGDTICYE